jgi:1-aminocyclopropane-1-carboxylate deaminase/D-cysteine desulfhydrase-like pyridoxal-dependent ACC family enzyme
LEQRRWVDDLTPVERRGSIWVKRDDLFAHAGVRGGKVRACRAIAQGAILGLVTAGSRHSPQVKIVARVARSFGLPCRIHTPLGPPTPEVQDALDSGAIHIRHRPGFNSVLIARARRDAIDRGWTEVPFGMECREAVVFTAVQTRNIPSTARRLVVPVGSGMTLAGILSGLERDGRQLPVLGVVVGADPRARLSTWAPHDWEANVCLVRSALTYGQYAEHTNYRGLELDPIYEAKCLPFVKPGDCLWVVGIR